MSKNLPILVLIILVLVFGGVYFKNYSGKQTDSREKMKIGEKEIYIEVADNNEKRSLGLGGRIDLAENEGMLFKFEQKDFKPSFWMKDMKMAIDIIWINDNKVIDLDEKIQPPGGDTKDGDLKFYTPSEPIDYVLEVESGFSERNKIERGSEVIIP